MITDFEKFEVYDIDDATQIFDEMLDDLINYGWLDVGHSDWYGKRIVEALQLAQRWIRYKQLQERGRNNEYDDDF